MPAPCSVEKIPFRLAQAMHPGTSYSPSYSHQQGSSSEREVPVQSLKAAALLLVLAVMGSAVLADTIAYVVPKGTSGNQNYSGALGMDFDVNSDIVVTQLG